MSDVPPRDQCLERSISAAILRIFREFYGKGAGRTRTYLFDNYVFCVLDDVLTPVERTLLDCGDGHLIREVRLAFQDLMSGTFTAEVQRLTERPVVAYHSQIVFDPNLAFELFVLGPERCRPPATEAHAGSEIAVEPAPVPYGDRQRDDAHDP